MATMATVLDTEDTDMVDIMAMDTATHTTVTDTDVDTTVERDPLMLMLMPAQLYSMVVPTTHMPTVMPVMLHIFMAQDLPATNT